MSDETRRLTVSSLARVEGEGALSVTIEDGLVTTSQLQIYEPPRFFEALLRGRAFTEVADITSRICGICPVAYQTSALQAVEDACGYVVPTEVAELRRLIYCGEWISSHALHIYLLHAPDFLGHPDVISLARSDRAAVERGLALKKVGNAGLEAVGGRAIHPVNMRVGGFHRAPTRTELAPLAE
jgi:sulfhydrogenase subunit alpha